MTASPSTLSCLGPLPAAIPGAPVVIKFGGTSLATAARVRRAARRVGRLWESGHQPVVVVSAAGHTTDRLLRRAAAVFGGPDAGTCHHRRERERDRALATGEDLSAALLAGALLTIGVPAVSCWGGEAGLLAAGEFGAGRLVTLRAVRLEALLRAGEVPVVAGFQGIRADGETVTLGRGGSDVTAVFLAVALRANECQIVTDVNGVYSSDPNRDPAARRFDTLEHRHLVRLADAGAAVVHPDAATLAARAALPLRVFHHRAPLHRPGGTIVGTGPAVSPC